MAEKLEKQKEKQKINLFAWVLGFFAPYREVNKLKKENPEFFNEYQKLKDDAEALKARIDAVNEEYGIK